MVGPEHVFEQGNIALVSGSDEAIEKFAQLTGKPTKQKSKFSDLGRLFRKTTTR